MKIIESDILSLADDRCDYQCIGYGIGDNDYWDNWEEEHFGHKYFFSIDGNIYGSGDWEENPDGKNAPPIRNINYYEIQGNLTVLDDEGIVIYSGIYEYRKDLND